MNDEALESAQSEIVDLIKKAEPSLQRRLARLRELIDSGIDVAEPTQRKWPGSAGYMGNLVHLAVSRPEIPGADVQLTPAEPLMIEALIKAGADPNLVDASGAVPFDNAVKFGRNDDALRTLWANGARPKGELRSFVRWASPTTMQVLLELGMPLETEKGPTPLYEAITAGRLDLVEFFLDQGADTSRRFDKNRTLAEIARRAWRDLDDAPARADALIERLKQPGEQDEVVPDLVQQLRAASKRLGADWKPHADFSSIEEFIEESLIPVDGEASAEVALVFREAMNGDGTTLELSESTEIDEPFFHHGDVIVRGDLSVGQSMLVTGRLLVDGLLEDAEETAIVCGGDVTARYVASFGGLYTAGSLVAEVLWSSDNVKEIWCETLRATLALTGEHHLQGGLEVKSLYCEPFIGDESLRELLVEEVFDAAGLSLDALVERMRAGEPVLLEAPE